ncbi:AAA family ATPase [Burkholderia stagnalis]|uniref:ATP-binding protein n=1 Tax=Burkholderia stagnalis TaxID=1503054 RepID=UPI00075FC126|nr:ATP-binding protein [Burkholderia stagnalis]KWK45809.1 AAA family ATPase [Burkholderia stagnalis]KWK51487.1 AAA family ATPase [Burkholderia stagnalis]KWN67819.1 AAA family ATPase [Burkholderia stagnalis]
MSADPRMPEPIPSPEGLLFGLAHKLERIAAALEAMTHTARPAAVDFDAATAFRWHGDDRATRTLEPIASPALIGFDALRNVERQAAIVERNTRQFVRGGAANHVLLTGARGTGKSSIVKACLHAFAKDDLPAIVERVRARPERYIVFCDDLSFESGETGYKGLKTVLDGSVASDLSNVLVYATSNRRHLLPEHASDNADVSRAENGELHPGDAVEERISLSERFGIWVTFYGFSQDQYLAVVDSRLAEAGFDAAQIRAAREPALQWALERGARSGRIAAQFVRDYTGRIADEAADGERVLRTG